MFGALAALIPIITQLVPALTSAIGSPVAGNILLKAGEAAQRVFGTTDVEVIKAEIERDKNKLEMFKAQLEASTKEDLAFLADTQNARQLTQELGKVGSAIAWGAPLLSALVTFGFFVVIVVFMQTTLNLDEFQKTVLNVLIGYLGASFQQVVNFWLGSTRDSQAKTAMLGSLASFATSNNAQIARTTTTQVTTAATEPETKKKMFR